MRGSPLPSTWRSPTQNAGLREIGPSPWNSVRKPIVRVRGSAGSHPMMASFMPGRRDELLGGVVRIEDLARLQVTNDDADCGAQAEVTSQRLELPPEVHRCDRWRSAEGGTGLRERAAEGAPRCGVRVVLSVLNGLVSFVGCAPRACCRSEANTDSTPRALRERSVRSRSSPRSRAPADRPRDDECALSGRSEPHSSRRATGTH